MSDPTSRPPGTEGAPQSTAVRTLPDAEARRAIREDLSRTLVVEAAAGTGKTTELVARIIALVRTGTARGLSAIAAVTFTEKAAGEMKLRIRAELERARTNSTPGSRELERLDRALSELEIARIGTIHSLCSDLLHERPVEAAVDPLFGVNADDGELLQRAFEPWFQAQLQDPPEGVRRILRRKARGRGAKGPRELLFDAGARLIDHRDYQGAWRRPGFDRKLGIEHAVSELRAFAAIPEDGDPRYDKLVATMREAKRFIDELDRFERGKETRDYDGIEAELAGVARGYDWDKKGRSNKIVGCKLSRAEVLAQREEVKAVVAQFNDEAQADLAACLREDFRGLIDAYEEEKNRSGCLDFLDLLIRARDLIKNDRDVRESLQKRFQFILVDEFQDTDPIQAELLLLLASDDPEQSDWRAVTPTAGKIFAVGDPKQSIYRFRRADVALYLDVRDRLIRAGAEVVHLTASFRSVPSIQSVVNAAFAPHMPGKSSAQADYVALQPVREEIADRPSIVALPVPNPYTDWGRITQGAIDASYPDAVGALCHHLLTTDAFQITEREDPARLVKIEARHICILFKRFQNFASDVTRSYVRALEARRIPHVLVGGRSYHEREEIIALRAALSAIEWPDDELHVFATLRGPFFALSDEHLLAYKNAFGALHPLRRHDPLPEDQKLAEVTRALSVLGKLNIGRNRRPVADTLQRLLSETRAHAGIAIWPAGEQALANLLRTQDLARRFEARGSTSFRAFVERLNDDAERGDVSEAPVVEEGTEGVRMMTVHRAKGLEFPIVILADPTAPYHHQNPSRYVDTERGVMAVPIARCTPHELVDHREEILERDREEAIRLTYVAATRARDMLVVPVTGDESIPGWLDVLDPAIWPEPRLRRQAEPCPQAPRIGEDTVLFRPNGAGSSEQSVVPGLHQPQLGDHRVLWWDPRTLELDVTDDSGLKQHRLLVASSDESESGGAKQYAAWVDQRKSEEVTAGLPTQTIITPTRIAELATSAAGGIQLIDIGGDRARRPHGARFGTLVHATLAQLEQQWPDQPTSAALTPTVSTIARLIGAPQSEVDAAADLIARALQQPVMVRAKSAAARGQCYFEMPITVRRDNGDVLEGYIDLAFRGDDDCWCVVDFKTDVVLTERMVGYTQQVQTYVDAIEMATGDKAEGSLLWL